MKAIRTAAALLVPLAVVACAEQGGDQTAMDEEQQPAAQQQDMTADTAGQRAAGGASFELSAKNESGITGTTRVAPQGDSLRVRLSLSGLTEGNSYAAHVHQGDCEQGGGVAVALSSVSGQADGTGSSTSTVARSALQSGQSYFVQAHMPDGTPAACGDVPDRLLGGGGQM